MASEKVYTYNPDEITLSFCARPLSGFADGAFCKVTPGSARFKATVGTDGDVTRSRIINATMLVEFQFMQTSESNDLMHELLDREAVGPLYIRDRNGRSQAEAVLAWVEGPPEMGFARDPEARVWKVQTGPGRIIAGGNNLLQAKL